MAGEMSAVKPARRRLYPPGRRGFFCDSRYPTLAFRHRRTTRKFLHKCVAHVLQIVDADLATVERVRGKPAQKREELHSLAQTRVCQRVLAVCDQVQELFLLRRAASEVRVTVAVHALSIQPHQPSA